MTTGESSVYCNLQINMHKFRILLLIPFMVSLCLSYFSQHPPLDTSKSFKNAPLISSLQSTSLEALQFAKVKQFSKAAPGGSPGTDALVHDSTHSPEPVRITETDTCCPTRDRHSSNPPFSPTAPLPSDLTYHR